MPEAETSLRLAFYLLQNKFTQSVDVAIDGAQVKTLEKIHFAIEAFLAEAECDCFVRGTEWRGVYRHASSGGSLRIHSNSGQGDVVATLRGGRIFRAECKRGTLVPSSSSSEYPLLREALGQLLTIAEVGATDILAVAVPHSTKFAELANRWRQAPLVERARIQILTITRENLVHGLNLS